MDRERNPMSALRLCGSSFVTLDVSSTGDCSPSFVFGPLRTGML